MHTSLYLCRLSCFWAGDLSSHPQCCRIAKVGLVIMANFDNHKLLSAQHCLVDSSGKLSSAVLFTIFTRYLPWNVHTYADLYVVNTTYMSIKHSVCIR
ncbi:hypothetical protein F4779DRAFT_571621, partial [Xylariaceae sp. FL0662B]